MINHIKPNIGLWTSLNTVWTGVIIH